MHTVMQKIIPILQNYYMNWPLITASLLNKHQWVLQTGWLPITSVYTVAAAGNSVSIVALTTDILEWAPYR